MIARIILGFGLGTACAGAPIDWPHLKLTRVAQGLNEPVVVTGAHDGSGRVFIAERFGKIKVLVNEEIVPEPFLDISPKVRTEHYSHGIMGMAFPPAFAARQHFYVHYTPDQNVVVLSRFHIPPGSSVAASDSEEVLLTTYLADQGPCAGEIAFGPDGYLYIGREASYNYQPQHFDNVLGKILRVDVESSINGYAIPPDNPFASHATHRREIWSWGLFHPHSLSFDRLTGDLYFTDQQGVKCEVNLQLTGRGGMDYGSPIPEYVYNDPWATYERYGATSPVFMMTSSETYGLTGHICRDTPPSRMNGIFFTGHLHSGQLAGLARDGTNWIRQNFPEAITVGHNFGEDEAGRLYAMSRYEGTIDIIEDSGKVRPPELLPSGVIQTDTPVLNSPTPGSRIRYTTNGTNTASGDPEIPSGQTITISTGMTVKAQALRDDLLPSDIITATYASFKVAYPIFVPGPSAVPNPTSITITSATPGAVIRYTTNGTAPTLSSPIYQSPVVVTGSQVLYARAYRAGFQESDLNGATYTWARAVLPGFVPASGPITNGTSVTMLSKTPGAVIRYTTNGADPTATSPKYTNSVRINGNTTLKAKIFAKGYQPSEVQTVFYDLVKVAQPTFDVAPGVVPYGTTVRLSLSTPGATLRYTTNGADPTRSSPAYSAPFTVYADIVIKARGYRADLAPSLIAVGRFELPKTPLPIFTPAQGPVPYNTLVTISCPISKGQIRYTTNGTEPTLDSLVYRRPFVLPVPVVLSARAFGPYMSPSDVATMDFTALAQESAFVQTLAGTTQPGFMDGPGKQAQFRSPHALCVDDHGTVYVADSGNNLIRKINTNGMVLTIAGTGRNESIDAVGTNASFAKPVGITIDGSGNLYVVDQAWPTIRVVTPDRNVRTLVHIPHWNSLWHIQRASSGEFFVGSWAQIVSVSTSNVITHFAGPAFHVDTGWGALTSVALDSQDRVYAVSGYQLLTFPGGVERSLAGGPKGFSDGPGLKARFTAPNGVTVGQNNDIFITDHHLVRRVSTNGYVSTLAGYAGPGFGDGPASLAKFGGNTGICVDHNGVVYVADANNHAIRKISFDRDQDSIPDPEDAAVGTDDRLVDSDGDGQSNAEEFWAATNPNNSNSTLRIQARHDGSNGVVVSWPTAPARSYVLASSTNLVDWQSSASVLGDGTTTEITNSFTPPRRFYRLRVEP